MSRNDDDVRVWQYLYTREEHVNEEEEEEIQAADESATGSDDSEAGAETRDDQLGSENN